MIESASSLLMDCRVTVRFARNSRSLRMWVALGPVETSLYPKFAEMFSDTAPTFPHTTA